MIDKLTEMRERYGRQHLPRLFARSTEEEQSGTHDHYVGVGIAIGAPIGLAVGVAYGFAFGNFATGIAFGLCLGTGVGIAIGSSLGERHVEQAEDPRPKT